MTVAERSRLADFLEDRVRPTGRISLRRFLLVLLIAPLPFMVLWLFVAPVNTHAVLPLLYMSLSVGAWYVGTLRLNDTGSDAWMHWNRWLISNLAIGTMFFAGDNLLTTRVLVVLVPLFFLAALYFGIRALAGLLGASEPRPNKYGPPPNEVRK